MPNGNEKSKNRPGKNGKKRNSKQRNNKQSHDQHRERPAAATGAPEPSHAKARLLAAADAGATDKAAFRLLLSYLMPLQYPPTKHSDAYGARPTADAHPWDQLDAAWFNRDAVAATFPSNFPLDVLVFCLMHDPKEFLLYSNFACSRGQKDGVALLSQYRWHQDGTALSTQRSCRPGDWYDFAIALDIGGTLARHGSRYWPKKFGDKSAMLMDFPPTGSAYGATQVIVANSVVFAVLNTYLFTCRCFYRGGYRDITLSSAGSGTTNFSILLTQAAVGNGCAYVALRYDGYYVTASGPAALDSTVLLLGVTATQYCDGISVLELPGLDTNEDAVDELRILGQSLMYTNDAAPQSRAGKRAQYQASGADAVDTFFYPPARTQFSNVAENQGAVSEDLEEGAFSWRKPGGIRDWDMIPLDGPKGNTGSGQGQGSVQNTSDYLVMAISAPIPAPGVTQSAQVGRFTYGAGVEFETEDTWRTIAAPSMDPIRYQETLVKLRGIDQHHTNKFHIASLLKLAKNAVRVTKPFRSVAAHGLRELGGANGRLAGDLLELF